MSAEQMPRREHNGGPKSHEDVYELIERVLDTIGDENVDSYGKRTGTGLVGRMMRLEQCVAGRFAKYDGWVKLVIGFFIAATIFGPIIWWLTAEKLGVVLK